MIDKSMETSAETSAVSQFYPVIIYLTLNYSMDRHSRSLFMLTESIVMEVQPPRDLLVCEIRGISTDLHAGFITRETPSCAFLKPVQDHRKAQYSRLSRLLTFSISTYHKPFQKLKPHKSTSSLGRSDPLIQRETTWNCLAQIRGDGKPCYRSTSPFNSSLRCVAVNFNSFRFQQHTYVFRTTTCQQGGSG
jgi:hypothetical protein